MYEVTFIRNDMQPEEIYYYLEKQDAQYHFELFRTDDSRLYKSITLSWRQNNEYTPLDIINF